MKTGYCFLRSAVTRISASSCLETAATCTINDPPAPFLASVPADGVTDWSGAFAVDDGWVAETSELLPAPASAVVAAGGRVRGGRGARLAAGGCGFFCAGRLPARPLPG